MFYRAKVAVCSEIRTKHINAMWAPRRILERRTWWCVKLQLRFKRLTYLERGLTWRWSQQADPKRLWLHTSIKVSYTRKLASLLFITTFKSKIMEINTYTWWRAKVHKFRTPCRPGYWTLYAGALYFVCNYCSFIPCAHKCVSIHTHRAESAR
jgi:hypothetical protein